MSEGSSVADTVEDSISAITDTIDRDHLDVESGGDEAVRESLGRELGARAGRELGAVVGRSIGELVAVSAREGNSIRSTLEDVRQFLVEVLSTLLRDADVRAALVETGEALSSVSRSDVASQSTESESESVSETDQASTSDAESRDQVGDGEEAPDAETDETRSMDEAAGSLASSAGEIEPEQIRHLREETFRELLDVMSYQDLQSIAKEMDVKANLDRETMTDRLVEAFTEDADASTPEESTG